jgi:hypothetical protein
VVSTFSYYYPFCYSLSSLYIWVQVYLRWFILFIFKIKWRLDSSKTSKHLYKSNSGTQMFDKTLLYLKWEHSLDILSKTNYKSDLISSRDNVRSSFAEMEPVPVFDHRPTDTIRRVPKFSSPIHKEFWDFYRLMKLIPIRILDRPVRSDSVSGWDLWLLMLLSRSILFNFSNILITNLVCSISCFNINWNFFK